MSGGGCKDTRTSDVSPEVSPSDVEILDKENANIIAFMEAFDAVEIDYIPDDEPITPAPFGNDYITEPPF